MRRHNFGHIARWVLLASCACLLLNGVVAAAVGMELPRWVIGGGEGSRTSGPLVLTATAGQPVASLTSATPLTMYWGYWGPGPSVLLVPVVLKK